MRRLFEGLAFALVTAVACSYGWMHLRHAAVASAPAPVPEDHETYTEEREANEMVTVTGPMADYMARHNQKKLQTLQPVAYKPSDSDRIAASPVGTTRPILQQTFNIAGIADLPFELPAHASTPQLRGTYHAFAQNTDAQATDDEAKVEFLLLNEREYVNLLSGRPSEALFSAEGMQDGEVNVSMPPTFGHAVRYYLVFRNDSAKAGKPAVKADFRLDF